MAGYQAYRSLDCRHHAAKQRSTCGALERGPGPQCSRSSRVRLKLCFKASFSSVRC